MTQQARTFLVYGVTSSPPDFRVPTGGVDSIGSEAWISASCFWNEVRKKRKVRRDTHFLGGRGFTLDGMTYQIITLYQIPSGYASLPTKVDDDGNEVDAVIVAGSLGTQYTRSDGISAGSRVGLDSVSPVSGWWIITKKQEGEESATSSGMIQALMSRLINLFPHNRHLELA